MLTTIAVGAVFATPLARTIGQWRDRTARQGGAKGGTLLAIDAMWLGTVFLAAVTFLAAGTYNPFIYFRF